MERSENSLSFTAGNFVFFDTKFILFVYNRAMLIFEAFIGKHLPARCRIGGNRHRPVLFQKFRLSSLRVNPYIALSAGSHLVTSRRYLYVPLSTADSRGNTVINRDPGETLCPIIPASFWDQLIVLFLHLVKTAKVPPPLTN